MEEESQSPGDRASAADVGGTQSEREETMMKTVEFTLSRKHQQACAKYSKMASQWSIFEARTSLQYM